MAPPNANPRPPRRPAPPRDRAAQAVDLGPFELEAGGPPAPHARLPARRARPGRAAGARGPRAHRLGRRGRRLVDAAHRPRPRLRHRPGRRPVRQPARRLLRLDGPAVDRPGHRPAAGARGSPPSPPATRPAPCGRSPTASASSRSALVTGGSMGGMIALEVALERPTRVDHVRPDRRAGGDGLDGDRLEPHPARARRPARRRGPRPRPPARDDDLPIRGRLRRPVRPRAARTDGRFSITSYLDHQGDKLVERFDPDTYRVLVRVMDGHDVGRGRGGDRRGASRAGRGRTSGSPALGIQGDILYGPAQVRALVADARARPAWTRLPRAPLDQGPRRVPDRVGPAGPDPGRRACRRTAPAGPWGDGEDEEVAAGAA